MKSRSAMSGMWRAAGLPLLALFAVSGVTAEAVAPLDLEAVFEGQLEQPSGDTVDALVFVRRFISETAKTKEVNQGFTLGAVILGEGDERAAAIFNVEQSTDGTLAWVPLYANAAHTLSAPPDAEAVYSGKLSWKGEKIQDDPSAELRLIPVDAAKNPSCAGTLRLKRSERYRWGGAISKGESVVLTGGTRQDATLQLQTAELSLDLGSTRLEGDFEVSTWGGGLRLLRRTRLNPKSQTLKSTDRQISAVGFWFEDQRWFHSGRRLLLISLTEGEMGCQFRARMLREK